MKQITVRTETPDDFRAIEVVHLSAFEGDQEAGFIEAIRDSSTYVPELSLVAEFNGRIVGHILLSKVRLQRQDDGLEILALAPMAVVPSQSHRGIGSELVHAAIDAAKEMGYKAIVEIGQPEFYKRFGFEPISRWNLNCSVPISGDLIAALELEEGALDAGGNVIYPAKFSTVY